MEQHACVSALLLGVDFHGWWCSHLCLGVHVSLCPHTGHEPAPGHRTCTLDVYLVWHRLQVLRVQEAAFPHCRTMRELSKLPSVPSMSTGWAGNTGMYLWQLSVATADMLMGNPRELTQGKPQEFVAHLIYPCICHGDMAAYLGTTLPSASCDKSRVCCHHIHHRSMPACAEFSFTVKVFWHSHSEVSINLLTHAYLSSVYEWLCLNISLVSKKTDKWVCSIHPPICVHLSVHLYSCLLFTLSKNF